jgi:hypothetical protein
MFVYKIGSFLKGQTCSALSKPSYFSENKTFFKNKNV